MLDEEVLAAIKPPRLSEMHNVLVEEGTVGQVFPTAKCILFRMTNLNACPPKQVPAVISRPLFHTSVSPNAHSFSKSAQIVEGTGLLVLIFKWLHARETKKNALSSMQSNSGQKSSARCAMLSETERLR